MKKRFTFTSILVLGFYLFHALSPLLYSAGNAPAEDKSGNLPCISITQSQPFVVDHTLLSATSTMEDKDSSSAPASRVLLKKKRALPASFKDIIEKLSTHYEKYLDFAPSSEIASIPFRIPGDSPVCPNGFQFYHSGISPPSA